ncbi:hypothetical protein FH972_021870 [Carpinus fangiana]|uniref:Uncharacterized protein n=1 Tax=Carpinus fangiana TaxID=176857 RepID=A0A5N6KQY3_9ROSI|nr:hypothetical protein FH972_021870 [Carpinus fangiana]
MRKLSSTRQVYPHVKKRPRSPTAGRQTEVAYVFLTKECHVNPLHLYSSSRLLTVEVYFPPTFYPNDSKVALDYQPWGAGSRLIIFRNITGRIEQYFNSYIFDSMASGKSPEKTIQMYLYERSFTDTTDPYNHKEHLGPMLTLVKTAPFPTTTTSYNMGTASPTVRPVNSSPDGSSGLPKAVLALIAIGIPMLVGLAALLLLRSLGRRSSLAKNRFPSHNFGNILPRPSAISSQSLVDSGRVRPSRCMQYHDTRTVAEIEVGSNGLDLPIAAFFSRFVVRRDAEDEELPAYTGQGEAPPNYAP